MKLVLMTLTIAVLIACGGRQVVAADAANPLFGTWRGTSICTPVRPACHDEIAVDHIAPSSKPDMVSMTMNKVVDGKEAEMGGTLDYRVDYAKRTLTYDLLSRDGTRGVISFTWSGKKMTGTLIQLPGREVVRNITLEKE